MAAQIPSKHAPDRPPDVEGLLNNLQDWELSYKHKEKKIKSKANTNEKSGSRVNGSQTTEKARPNFQGAAKKYDYMSNYDSVRPLSTGLMMEEGPIDANSEKELGNEYFKQKKFNEAIDCYSRSIAFSPTSVTYANRAMAYLKIKRFQEAENDCTEALSLDDRYIKAYSRRSTAKKELGKLRESIDDAEFALRLEPHNQEIKKQYSEVKSLYEKELLKKASEAGAHKGVTPKIVMKKSVPVSGVGSDRPQQGLVSEIPEERIQGIARNAPAESSMEIDGKARSQTSLPPVNQLSKTSAREAPQKSTKNGKQELKASLQELAVRAASLAKAEAAKNIVAPNSAYQFEASWRGLTGDRSLQTHLLKVTSPTKLPEIFKNALSPSLFIDIIKCVATFFIEEMDLAVKYLENLVKVPRFDMIVMSLPATEKADLCRTWDEVFIQATPEYIEILGTLRSRYIIKL